MDWQSIGQAVVLFALGAYTALNSRKAKRNTKAVGNGFADGVTGTLTRLERAVGRVESKIDSHLQDHASSDVRGGKG